MVLQEDSQDLAPQDPQIFLPSCRPLSSRVRRTAVLEGGEEEMDGEMLPSDRKILSSVIGRLCWVLELRAL
jgi:hypothetical protein